MAARSKIRSRRSAIADSVIIFEGSAPQPSRKLEISAATANLRKSDGRIGLSGKLRWKGEPIGFRLTTNLPASATPAAPVPMILDVDSRLLSGGFNGETSLKGALNAAGYLSLATPDMPALAKWAGWPLQDGMPGVVQLTGSLNLAPDWVSLQAAAFAAGGAESHRRPDAEICRRSRPSSKVRLPSTISISDRSGAKRSASV